MIELVHGQSVYIDSNVFIYAVENDQTFSKPALELFQSIAAGLTHGLTSELTFAEVLVKPLRQNNRPLVAIYEQLFIATSLAVIPISKPILREAADIRARTGQKLPDCIHAATALQSKCSMIVSQDQRLKVPGLTAIALSEMIKTG